jgi:hypothetical protein
MFGVIKTKNFKMEDALFGEIKGWISQNARCIVWNNKRLDMSKWKVHCLVK